MRLRRIALLWLSSATACAVVAIAVLGPLVADSPTASVDAPFLPPAADHPLGTDVLGRDVFSRLLAGGWAVVATATGATALATVLGITIGVLAALASHGGELLFRAVDLFAVVPAILLLLVLAAGFPGSDVAVLVAVALSTTPFSARVVRAAAQRVVTTGYVEVALARGDGKLTVLAKDVVPNVAGPVLAESGLRFVAALYLTSTAGFLGLGAAAPAANWGRMVAENLPGAALTVWPFLAPTGLLVLLAVSVNLLADDLAHRIDGANS